jgi:hypothetical protein
MSSYTTYTLKSAYHIINSKEKYVLNLLILLTAVYIKDGSHAQISFN